MKIAAKHKELCDKNRHISQPLSPNTVAFKAKIEHQSLLNTFNSLELPLPSSPDTWLDFASLSKVIRKFKVVGVMARVLDVILQSTHERNAHHARVFLCAYMILMCTSDILPDCNCEQEQNLYLAAKDLLLQFENWVGVCQQAADDEVSAREKVREYWLVYEALFEAWKTKDQHELIEGMSAYYIELVRLQISLGEDGEKEGVDDTITKELPTIRDKVHRMGGQKALQNILHEENLLRSGHAAQLARGQNDTAAVTDEGTPKKEVQEETKLNSTQVAEILDRYSSALYDMSNFKLAHELIVDPEFKLQKNVPKSDLEKRVQSMATKAFFDKLEDDYESGLWKQSLPALVTEVRERLLDLVKPDSVEHDVIEELLDIAMIERQVEHNVFNIDELLEHVISIMSRICAPIRDEEIQAIRKKGRSVDQLRAILESLDDISLDLANFRLRALRPEILKTAVEYERCKFEELLEKGHITLDRTRKWIGNAAQQLKDTAEQRNPENVPLKTRVSTDAAFQTAFVSFVTGAELISDENVPETLAMDVQRLEAYQNEIHAITAVAALMTLSKNFGVAGEKSSKELAEKFFLMLEDHSTTTASIAEEIVKRTKATSEQIHTINAMVDKTMAQNDIVYSLFARRITSCVLSHLRTNQEPNDVTLSSLGLICVGKQLCDVSRKLCTLAKHHSQVFLPWYNEILKSSQSGASHVTY